MNDMSNREEQFISTVRSSLDEAERLLREATNTTGERAAELRQSAMEALRRTRETMHDKQDELVERGRQAARMTDEYVHEQPWRAIGVAALAGVVIGALLSRR